jgi:hypothetical protein
MEVKLAAADEVEKPLDQPACSCIRSEVEGELKAFIADDQQE